MNSIKVDYIIHEIKMMRQELMNKGDIKQGEVISLIAAYDSLLAALEENKQVEAA